MKKKRIVQILRIIMPIVAISSLLIFAPLESIWLWLTPLPDAVQQQVDDSLDYGLDGVIVFIDPSGFPPAYYSAGWKNKLALEPADPHALFKIGSISKLYMAAAIAQLVNDQTLSLDKTLIDYLPELAESIEYADQITLRMLVQHRSGIPDFIDQDGFDWFTPHTDMQKTLELVLHQPAAFRPDSRYQYSNTNYLLLGLILDKVLGFSHQKYIETEILAPLGIAHTFGTLRQADFDQVVSGYWYAYEDDLRELDFTIPGGSMVASAQDVGIFLRALNDGSLLNEDEQAIYSSIYVYEHTGWLPGYHSIARYFADLDTVVILFVSTTGGDRELITNVVYHRIIKILNR